MSKTVISVYDTIEQAKAARQELLSANFNADAVLLLAGDPATQHIRRIEGGIIGTQNSSVPNTESMALLNDAGVPHTDQERYRAALMQGSTVVIVAASEQRTDEASEILLHHQPIPIASGARQGHDDGWAGSAGAESMQIESLAEEFTEEYDQAGALTGATGGATDTRYSKPGYTEDTDKGDRHSKGIYPDVHSTDADPLNRHVRPPLDATTEPGGTGHGHSKHVDREGYTPAGGHEVSYAATSDDAVAPDFADYRNQFVPHYEMHFAHTGLPFSAFEPAYRLGFELGNHPELSHRLWTDIEPEAQRLWQSQHDEPSWEQVAEAVQRGWTWLRA